MTIQRSKVALAHLDNALKFPRGWAILAAILVTWLVTVVGALGIVTVCAAFLAVFGGAR